MVALDVNLVDLDFLVLVDHDVDNHLVLLAQVLALVDGAHGFLKSLSGKVLLDNLLDAVGDVGSHLAAGSKVHTLGEVFFLAALHAQVVDLRDAWLLSQVEHEPSLVLIHFLDLNLHLGEKSLTPESLHGSLEVLSGNLDALADGQAAVSDDDVVLVVVNTLHADARNGILRGSYSEHNLGVVDRVVYDLSLTLH